MGATPAYIFVIRHGSRLDAADKRWHLSSPTPYDPPLTYGGFLQSRLVGNQIAGILQQAKAEYDAGAIAAKSKKRRRFKVVIHSSPFLRCVQTSVGISSGLAQTPPECPHQPSDVLVSATGPSANPDNFRSAILRLDSFLGEWLSPEYFEMITPPPGAALMMGSAKAELLRREDYSHLANPTTHSHRNSSGSLWNGSPNGTPIIPVSKGPPSVTSVVSVTSDKDLPAPQSAMAAALSGKLTLQLEEKKGYSPPRPNYAISSAGKIPDGFVAHARDQCVVVDYQWDSMRPPLDFGDGGQFGEEWTHMHKRFRRGLQKLVAWYSTADTPTKQVTYSARDALNGTGDGHVSDEEEEDDVETVAILVSHGAGCNALIGAITHQPVLMDVGIASITMATRKPNVRYDDLFQAAQSTAAGGEPHVSPHQLYDMRMSASTEHLRSNSSTPVSARSVSGEVVGPLPGSSRGRAPSTGSSVGGPVIGSFVYSDDLMNGNRSTSASAALGSTIRRNSGSQRPVPRSSAMSPNGTGPRNHSPGNATSKPTFGLWAPAPSSLRLMDDAGDDDLVPVDDSADGSDTFDDFLPDFGQSSFRTSSFSTDRPPPTGPDLIMNTADIAPAVSQPRFEPEPPSPALPNFTPFALHAPADSTSMLASSVPTSKQRGPILAAPIRIHTGVDLDDKPAQEMAVTQLGDGLGGLWGVPPPPGEAERLRDMSLSKRRWTTTEWA